MSRVGNSAKGTNKAWPLFSDPSWTRPLKPAEPAGEDAVPDLVATVATGQAARRIRRQNAIESDPAGWER